MDIVLQGPLHEYTPTIAKEYAKLPFVNNIIISCWDTCPLHNVDDNIFVLRNSDTPTAGFGNRNRQIKSSRAGLDMVVTEFSAKLRTDQLISRDSMFKLYQYYFENCEYISTSTTNVPYNRIGVHGICRDFAFHPIDHIFWGNTNDLYRFFDVEYENKSPTPNGVSDFNHYVRSETYITLPYIVKHHNELSYLLDEESKYLLDNSPKREEILTLSERIMPELFVVFPKIELNWIKYGMTSYHYDVMETSRGGRAYWANSV